MNGTEFTCQFTAKTFSLAVFILVPLLILTDIFQLQDEGKSDQELAICTPRSNVISFHI